MKPTPQELIKHEQALGLLNYGMYIVSSHAQDKKNGQIINVASQVTAEPMQVVICLNKQNLTHDYITQSGVFGLSILEQSTPFKVIGTWGFKSGRDVDKFKEAGHREGKTGVPLLIDHTLATLECEVVSCCDANTHSLFLGRVVGGEVLREGVALTYDYYRHVIKGKASKNAPTFRTQGH
ncbi:flavin reductase family protein [bacterium]|nr:flavin reductase family protein [bacterium]